MPSPRCMPGEVMCSCRTCHRMRPYRRERLPDGTAIWVCTWCGKADAAVTPEQQDENMRQFTAEMEAADVAFRASRGAK